MTQPSIRDGQLRLEQELSIIQGKLGINDGLKLVWQPDLCKALSGEVNDGIVYIYESCEEAALQVLHHEILDYYITSRVIDPLVSLVNMLIKSRANDVYREKERIIDALVNWMT
jgi:hypothetical protein